MNASDTIMPALRTAKPKFERNEQVILTGSKLSNPRRATVVASYDFKDALRLRDAKGEFIVSSFEVLTAWEYAALVQAFENEKLNKLREKYKPIIDLWESGKRSASEIAMLLDRHHLAVASQIAAAKRVGFIR